jgi:hypothetical protein
MELMAFSVVLQQENPGGMYNVLVVLSLFVGGVSKIDVQLIFRCSSLKSIRL